MRRLDFRFGFQVLRFHSQGFSACIQFVLSASIAKEAVVPYSDEAGRNDVEHETPDEFHAVECHAFLPVVITIVLPAEGDGVAVHRHKAAVTYCHSMRIPSRVFHHSLVSREGRFDVHHPMRFIE